LKKSWAALLARLGQRLKSACRSTSALLDAMGAAALWWHKYAC
jgi:hypothetical protein